MRVPRVGSWSSGGRLISHRSENKETLPGDGIWEAALSVALWFCCQEDPVSNTSFPLTVSAVLVKLLTFSELLVFHL